MTQDAESTRLGEDARREKNWKRWGPYLSERQWATVREDTSSDGSFWESFPYEHSSGRAYRWGEDGLLGITDRQCRLCFAIALWNGEDPHLKERLFGLTNHEGNHAEDVKEVYFYLDATPTHSYLKALYKYPQSAYPYEHLRAENKRFGRERPEYELTDTGAFDADRYWDVTAEYAKASPDDILIRISVANRAPEPARLHVLPTLWFRNTWSWGAGGEEGTWPKPRISRQNGGLLAEHETLGRFRCSLEEEPAEWLITENETNPAVHGGGAISAIGRKIGLGGGPYKDAFHDHIVGGTKVKPIEDSGTKSAALYVLDVPPRESRVLRLRLTVEQESRPDPFEDFGAIFESRRAEADSFYAGKIPESLTPEVQAVSRQAYAGLLWSEQFYQYIVPDWLPGDHAKPLAADEQQRRMNRDWGHLYSRDVISVPDKWEYPAFFAWDLAFHMIPMARIDPEFAKAQLLLLLREWYLHPNGQLPAFEYDLSNVNPPVHAWACWQVYEIDGKRDLLFLERVFHKLLMNFTWWVNRKDPDGRNVFGGGFLGMDNLGIFDRSGPLPSGGTLQQADGTAWMGFYCTSMLKIAVELALHNRAYEDVASKFFEHFVSIADAINHLGGRGLWDEDDGFYYDQILADGRSYPLKLRAMIGIIPLLAVHILEEQVNREKFPEFEKRLLWFLEHRKDQMKHLGEFERQGESPHRRALLSLTTRDQLVRALRPLLDEAEFLSPFGIRSLSKSYEADPYIFHWDGGLKVAVKYVPGDMDTGDFGGNSNWRGPIWFPINYLLIEAIGEYHRYFGDSLKVECPTGSGRMLTLGEVARELAERLGSLFIPAAGKPRPCHGTFTKFADDPHWKDYVLFHEYFHGDTGRGLGASHQTGWSALVAKLIENCARHREDQRG